MLASSVVAIDDVPTPQPTTEQQIEAMVGRLGDVGIAAAADALVPELEGDPSELVSRAGNLPGTPT